LINKHFINLFFYNLTYFSNKNIYQFKSRQMNSINLTFFYIFVEKLKIADTQDEDLSIESNDKC